MAAKTANRFSAINLVVAILVGEFALAGIPSLARDFVPASGVIRWLIATVILALGSYYLFGLPQIKLWQKGQLEDRASEDVRLQWGQRILSMGGPIGYIFASAVGGPPLIGWHWCANNLPRPERATFGAAWILASAWAAIYYNLAATLGWWLAAVVLMAVTILGILTWRQGRIDAKGR